MSEHQERGRGQRPHGDAQRDRGDRHPGGQLRGRRHRSRGSPPEHGHAHPHPHGPHRRRGQHHGGDRDASGNPRDLSHYLARLEGPDRAAWQQPDRVVRSLRLRPGDVACDIGVGPGYFALRMARAVGDRGTVYAVDVEPRMIDVLRQRTREAGLSNVHPILARRERDALPPRLCQVILLVNTFHHFPAGARTLRRLASRLAPGGRIVNVDFHKRELPVGPPPDHKVDRGEFLAEAARAGLRVARERRFLPYQYFLELEPVPARARPRDSGRGSASRGRGAPRSRPGRAASRAGSRPSRSRARPRRAVGPRGGAGSRRAAPRGAR
jgi:SAM-dependent methyltransferase